MSQQWRCGVVAGAPIFISVQSEPLQRSHGSSHHLLVFFHYPIYHFWLIPCHLPRAMASPAVLTMPRNRVAAVAMPQSGAVRVPMSRFVQHSSPKTSQLFLPSRFRCHSLNGNSTTTHDAVPPFIHWTSTSKDVFRDYASRRRPWNAGSPRVPEKLIIHFSGYG